MANDQTTPREGITATTTVSTGEQPPNEAIPVSWPPPGGVPAAAPGAGPAAGPASAAPATTPIVIDGAAIVPPASIGAPVTQPDGKQVTSSELFSADGVTFTRETATRGINPIDGRPGGIPNQFENTLVINTGSGDDQVNVSRRTDGTLDVQVNGKAFHVTLGPGQELGVRTGDGNDVIQAAHNVTVNMDVRGGAGNDTIITGQGRDRIDAGSGDDIVRSGAGRDDVFGNTGNDAIDAGDGHDVVYGGDGDDVLQGGRGRDMLEGGKGNDALLGGSGDDVLSGGLGDDSLLSQEGQDAVYTGAGADTVTNSAGNDWVYRQSAEDVVADGRGATSDETEVGLSGTPGSTITITGSPEFRQRVEADMEFLRASPEGRGLLTELDAAANAPGGKAVTIREMTYEENGRAWPGNGGHFQHTIDPVTHQPVLTLGPTGQPIPGPGVASTVGYNPSFHSDRAPAPGLVLFHELSHAYNNVTGTKYPGAQTGAGIDRGIRFAEHQAVGLPGTPAPYAFPGGGGAATGTNPFSEIDLRREMRFPDRPSYRPGTPDGGLGSPTAMVPTGTGGTSFPATGDPVLDRMLAASQSGNLQDLRQASSSLYERDGGQFKEQGVVEFARQQSEQAPQAKAEAAAPPQVEPPEQQVASIGGMRR